MNNKSTVLTATKCLLIALTISAGFSLALCVMRGFALFDGLRLFATSGEEGTVIYTVWKAAHGYPIYHLPGAGLYDSAVYNVAFYDIYAWFARLLGRDGDGLVAVDRLLTCLSGLVGAIAQYRIVGILIGEPRSKTERSVLILMTLLTWFGGSYMNWWLFTVRPDVAAVALAMVGVWMWLRAIRAPAAITAGPAIICFYAAWAFKQTIVWSLTGAVISGFSEARSRKISMVLCAVLAALFLATLYWGGAEYRYQTIYLSSLNKLSLIGSVNRAQQLLLPLALIWVFALLPLILRLSGKTTLLQEQDAYARSAQRMVTISCVLALVMGTIAMGKDGSGRNHVMEGVVLSSILACASLIRAMRCDDAPVRRNLVLLAAGLALILCGRPIHSLLLDKEGIRRGGPQDVVLHGDAERVLETLPKPAYCDDDILGQPWHANGNRYPGYVPDVYNYSVLKADGLVTDGGLSYLISHQVINSILVLTSPFAVTELLDPARHAGFTPVALPPDLARAGYVALVRSGTGSAAPGQPAP